MAGRIRLRTCPVAALFVSELFVFLAWYASGERSIPRPLLRMCVGPDDLRCDNARALGLLALSRSSTVEGSDPPEPCRTFPTPFPFSLVTDTESYPARMVCPCAPRPVPGRGAVLVRSEFMDEFDIYQNGYNVDYPETIP